MRIARPLPQAYRYGIIAFILGILFSGLLAYLLAQRNEQHIQDSLIKASDDIGDQVLARFHLYQYGLRGMRGSILTAGTALSRQTVAAYSRTRNLAQEFPGSRGFGFIRRVPLSQEATFLTQARLDDWPQFYIHQFTPHQGERFVIQYIEPIAPNRAAIGLDVASEPKRREAALAAMQSGETRLTPPITLVQASGNLEQSFLILLPIYPDGIVPSSMSEREAKAIGWSYAPLVMAEVLTNLRLDRTQLRLQLSDISSSVGVQFYDSANGTSLLRTPYTASKEIKIFGRTWALQLSAQPAFIQNLHLTSPYTLMLVGVLLSSLLASLVTAVSINRRRHHQLQAEQQRLAAIVSSSADGIIGKTCAGIITDWNPAATQLFGYSAAEAVGKRMIDLLVPAELASEEHEILRRINLGLHVPHFQTQRRCRDGRLLDVSVTVSPIWNAQKQVIGASKTVRDITQQKANEARIQELNSNLEAQVLQRTTELSRVNLLLSNVLRAATEVSIIAADSNGVITLFNRGAERLLGYCGSDLIGCPAAGLFHTEEEIVARGIELSAEYAEEIKGFQVFVYKPILEGAETREWTYRHRDGSHIPVSLSVTAMRDDAGEIVGYLGIAIDIRKRKAAEQKLASSLNTNQAILDTVVNPVFTINCQGLLCSFNPAAEQMFDLNSRAAIGQAFIQLIPDMLEQHPQSNLIAYLNGEVDVLNEQGWEVQAQRKNGTRFSAQLSLGGMQSDGERRVVGVITDLSQIQKQQAEVLAVRDQLRLASDVAELGVWSWIIAENTLLWNERMFEFYDQPIALREQGLNYQHWYERIHPEDAEATVACLTAAIEGRDVYAPTFRVIRRNGEILYIQAGAKIERDAQGKALRVTGINRDITIQRELEARLRNAKEQADAASAAKSTFLANMSHEIRTPMNAVLGMLQLIRQTELTSRQQDYIFKAQGAATALLGLLNDILDYSKIEAGKLQLDPHAFELEALMRNLAIVLPSNLGKEHVEVMFDIDPSLPQQILGDSLRLLQVLINLSGNALKFTQHGLVQVQVKAMQRKNDAICLRFAVQDTGIGISAEQQTRIFTGFTQAEASTTRRFGGTGLGLAISQRLVALMGGELQLESELGKGSCFHFELWLPIIDAAPLISLADLPALPLSVLIVEDNAMVAELIVRIISALGWQAQHVSNGIDAIHAVQSARQQGQNFELILMDWKMPGLDGLSAARLILKDYAQTPPPLLIMLTAYDKEMLLAALNDSDMPFVDFLTKPVTPQQLLLSVQKALGSHLPTTRPIQERKHLPLAGLHLLVIEDNALNRQIAYELLSNEGATVAVAEGGLSGVEQVLSATLNLDAVLMDVQMPDIDGLEATRRIRADGRFADLPIIAMTANASQMDRQACLDAGMNEHVGKPVDLPQLIHVLLKHCRFSNLEQGANIHQDSSTLLEPLSSILLRFGSNEKLYRSVQNNFQKEINQHLKELLASINTQNTNAARQALHAIKGSAGTLGAHALSVRAGTLEQELKNAPDTPLAEYLNPSVLSELEQLLIDSDNALKAQLSHAPSALAVSTATLSVQQHLLKLLPLLESGNMHALELMEAWFQAQSDHKSPQFIQLNSQIQALDFPAAQKTLQIWLANLENHTQ